MDYTQVAPCLLHKGGAGYDGDLEVYTLKLHQI